MEASTSSASYRSGEKVLKNGPKFLYEVTLYKDYKDRSEIVDSRFYSSTSPVTYKEIEFCKMDDYILVKSITWLEAPLDYLLSNGFKESNEKVRRTRKSSSRKNS